MISTFFAMLLALVVWDFIRLVWWSYRRVMNRDYDGGWWPAKKPKRKPWPR